MPGLVTVVGIGADGWAGLGERSRTALQAATVIVGGPRQLALIDDAARVNATRVGYPKPLRAGLLALIDTYGAETVVFLASGDPMMFGVGTTLSQLLGPAQLRVIPHVSSVSLACARLGWAVEDAEVVSAVGRSLASIHPALQHGRQIIVMSPNSSTPAQIADLLVLRGFGGSSMTVLEQLGGPGERVSAGLAETWAHPPGDALNLVAILARADSPEVVLPRQPGLPDSAYEHDGQLTKRDVRAVTLARLAPSAGELLWDVGAGSGSIGIEWMRSHPSCRAIAVEAQPTRADRLRRNAEGLGVPDLNVVVGSAPDALRNLPTPDAIFIGGGGSDAGVLGACWDALRPGGRLVANAVTLETESTLIDAYRRLGGELTRLAVSHVAPIGEMLRWSPAAPVTQWVVTKPEATQ